MEPIRVPAPPKQAFNKHRRVSDLIRKQVHHFKHLEQKLPENVREQIPQHHVVTEDDAAKYIAAMTEVLLSGELKPPQTKPATAILRRSPTKTAIVRRTPAKASAGGLTLAAAADKRGKPRAGSSNKKAVKRSGKGKKK